MGLSEFIGTAMLVISINWSSTSDSTAFAVGATVFVMATIFGGVSGGHFNPAVTIGMLWKESWINNFHDHCPRSWSPFRIRYCSHGLRFQKEGWSYRNSKWFTRLLRRTTLPRGW